MADPLRGRGRGLELIKTLRAQRSETPCDENVPSLAPSSVNTFQCMSAVSSNVPSVCLSGVSSTTDMSPGVRGRGKITAMLNKMRQEKEDNPITCPASDVSPSVTSLTKGRGGERGLKLIQALRASRSVPGSSRDSGVQSITEKMADSTISSTLGKNKYFREIKETPPVVNKGETGTLCEVTTNFMYLNIEENNVFEYEVRYEPEQDHRHLRYKLLDEHKELLKVKTFDGTTLYVPHRLPNDITNLVSTNPYDNSKIHITIVFNRPRRLSEMIHIYNILFNNIMKDLKLVRFGREYYNDHAAIQIPQHKLEVWPGYVTAVDEYEGGLMLTLDSTHRVLRTQNVLELVQETVMEAGANWKRVLTERLVGYSVMTTYNNKLFRVDAIDDTITPRSTFEKKENGEMIQISYIDYYKKNYGIDLMNWDQPILISRDTKRVAGAEKPVDYMICLIPELCQLTGLSDDQRSNFRLMKDVATYTRITPNQRHAAFKKYIKDVLNNETSKKRLEDWGLRIAPETVDITARTLPPETIYLGNNIKVAGKPSAEWNSEVTRHPVMQAVDIMRWAILYTDKDKQSTMNFVETVQRCCKPMGITIMQPQLVRLANDRIDSYVVALKKVIQSQLQVVVAICPTQRDDRYVAIKRICCAENPVPSQVINARTIMNQQKIRSVTQKIMLQVNCKVGGTLWNIHMPLKSAMVIGIDTYHDPSRKKRSVCGFVASYTQPLTQWYSKAMFQERGQEIVDYLKVCLLGSLQHYLRTNGHLPDRIIMYRDGVGDGQLKQIQTYEIPQLKLCIKEMDSVYQPKITFVVVQKRINTRIFLKCPGGEFDNPPPGTVVDHAITKRDWYDFLICSQKVNQGSLMPTHYVVVYDDSNMTADQCQRLTYKLCHLYYNWPGTVRVPAPCQYAHKLAYLVGQHMGQEPSAALADKLFFL